MTNQTYRSLGDGGVRMSAAERKLLQLILEVQLEELELLAGALLKHEGHRWADVNEKITSIRRQYADVSDLSVEIERVDDSEDMVCGFAGDRVPLPRENEGDAFGHGSSPCSECGSSSVGDAGRRASGDARPSTERPTGGAA